MIRPTKVTSGGELAEQILDDLIAQGLSGDELLTQFKILQSKIRPAVEVMIAESEAVAADEGGYATYDDVFVLKD